MAIISSCLPLCSSPMTSHSCTIADCRSLNDCYNRNEQQDVRRLWDCYSVKVEGLGVFSAFIANQKGGAPDPSKFNIQEHVKGVRFRFRPDSSDLDNLTSKTFGKHVSLGNGSYVLEKGNKAPKYPLAAYQPQP